jgi:hypothetical protein
MTFVHDWRNDVTNHSYAFIREYRENSTGYIELNYDNKQLDQTSIGNTAGSRLISAISNVNNSKLTSLNHVVVNVTDGTSMLQFRQYALSSSPDAKVINWVNPSVNESSYVYTNMKCESLYVYYESDESNLLFVRPVSSPSRIIRYSAESNFSSTIFNTIVVPYVPSSIIPTLGQMAVDRISGDVFLCIRLYLPEWTAFENLHNLEHNKTVAFPVDATQETFVNLIVRLSYADGQYIFFKQVLDDTVITDFDLMYDGIDNKQSTLQYIVLVGYGISVQTVKTAVLDIDTEDIFETVPGELLEAESSRSLSVSIIYSNLLGSNANKFWPLIVFSGDIQETNSTKRRGFIAAIELAADKKSSWREVFLDYQWLSFSDKSSRIYMTRVMQYFDSEDQAQILTFSLINSTSQREILKEMRYTITCAPIPQKLNFWIIMLISLGSTVVVLLIGTIGSLLLGWLCSKQTSYTAIP